MNLNARGDMKLGTLLADRGFGYLSQLLRAYRGGATEHASRRRVYLSFHVEDIAQVRGFRLMARAPNLAVEFFDGSLREAVKSARAVYVKQRIASIMNRSSVIVCLIGNGTAWREWVEWELETGVRLRKGICGIRLKRSRGRAPQLLRDINAPVAGWGDVRRLVATIECAAARRS